MNVVSMIQDIPWGEAQANFVKHRTDSVGTAACSRPDAVDAVPARHSHGTYSQGLGKKERQRRRERDVKAGSPLS